jgi:ankyrin repeat protein
VRAPATGAEPNRCTTRPTGIRPRLPSTPVQAAIVEYLIAVGGLPDAFYSSGVSALHRAVRTRCSAAVGVLLDNGADPRLKNKRGSTPLHPGVQNTGRTDSGATAAKDEQRRIIGLLLEHGAQPADTDAKGKTATDAAASAWTRDLLSTRAT